MTLCALCGLTLYGDVAVCPHHHAMYGDHWAAANRIVCDLVHRRKEPARLADPTERLNVQAVTS